MPNNNQQPTKPKPDAPLFDRVATIIGQARANVVKTENGVAKLFICLQDDRVKTDDSENPACARSL